MVILPEVAGACHPAPPADRKPIPLCATTPKLWPGLAEPDSVIFFETGGEGGMY